MRTESTISITLTAGELSDIIKNHLGHEVPKMMEFTVTPMFSIGNKDKVEADTIRFDGVMVDESHLEFPPRNL